MSAPPGHNAETSLLQGGDSVPIQAQQGGGSENISLLQGGEEAPIHPQSGGQVNPETVRTAQEKEDAARAAITAMAVASAIPGVTDEIINKSAEEAGLAEMKKQDKARDEAGLADILADATKKEKMAAEKATQITALDPEFPRKFPTTELQNEALHKVALAAITEERKKRAIPVVETVETLKATMPANGTASFNIKNQLSKLETYRVHSEFYTFPETIPVESTYLLSGINERLTRIQKNTNSWVQSMLESINDYKIQRKSLWENVLKNTGNKVAPNIPINNIQQVGQNEIFTQFSRYIHCLPIITESIIVIPPIRGDILKFHKAINRLQRMKALKYEKRDGTDIFTVKKNTVIVFMPSFFTDIAQTPMNMLMFSLFLDIHKSNANQVFLLSQSSADNYAMGALFAHNFGAKNSTNSSNLTNITMLEPTYIIYPYKRMNIPNGILISGSTELEKINMPKLHAYTLEDLKGDTKYGKTMSIAFKPSLLETQPNGVPFEEGASAMFTIRSYSKQDDTIPINLEGTNTGIKSCDGLLTDDPKFFARNGFFVNTVNVLPEAKDLETTTAKDTILVIRLNPTNEYVQLCREDVVQQGGRGKDFTKFKSSPKAVKQGVYHEQIDINGAVYNLRFPDDRVKNDWLQKIFTSDEAEFMNSIHITPQILNTVFGDKYMENLVNFLDTLIGSKCLTDTSLLMNSECVNCRDFLKRVNSYFLQVSLDRELVEDECSTQSKQSTVLKKEINMAGVTEHGDSFKGAKTNFKMIDPYIKIDSNSTTREAEIIGLNTILGNYKWFTISVLKTGNETADKAAIQRKIDELKKTYGHYKFIY